MRPELFAELVRGATRVSLRGLGIDDVREYLVALTGRTRRGPRPLTCTC
jgi:hypothetical protein